MNTGCVCLYFNGSDGLGLCHDTKKKNDNDLTMVSYILFCVKPTICNGIWFLARTDAVQSSGISEAAQHTREHQKWSQRAIF